MTPSWNFHLTLARQMLRRLLLGPAFAVQFVAVLLLTVNASGQIVPQPGFVVDQFIGRLDNSTPRIIAVTNPAYGSGVITVSANNGIATVRRITAGNVETLAVIPGLLAAAVPYSLRFDSTGLFAHALHMTIGDTPAPEVNQRTRLYRIGPAGGAELLWTSELRLGFTLDFTTGSGGYMPGAYMLDGNGSGGSAIWRMNVGPTFVQLSANSVPTGRTDVDIAGLQFDPTGLYGGHLILADCDANSDNRAAIYALLPNLTWQAISSLVTTPVRCYGDLTISPGGALGQSIYVTEKVTNTITTVAPNGTHSVWASGFVGIESISAASDGESLYVSDFNGVYRIRPTGNVPGPVLIAREPSLPGTQPFKTTDPIYSARLIWNAPIFFGNSDVVVTNAKGEDVPVSVSGSGSQFLLISFGTPLYTNTYTITVRDTVRSVTGSIQIDGDNNGISGGDAVIQMMHLCPSDVNNNGIVNSQDFFDFLTAFFTGC